MIKFSGICLITNNVPALTKFYTKVLSVTAERNDVHADIKTEGVNLSIFSVQGMEGMVPSCMQSAGHGSFTIGFKVGDLDREFQRLKAMNIKFLMQPTAHPWGYRSFWFRDPDGNIVDFYTKQIKQ